MISLSLAILVALWSASLCQFEADSENLPKTISIKRSIQADEMLTYEIEELFPMIEKDLKLLDYHPSRSRVEGPKDLREYDHYTLTEGVTEEFTFNDTARKIPKCSHAEPLDQHSIYLVVCEDKRLVGFMEVNNTEDSVVFHSNYTVPEDEEIEDLTTNAGPFFSQPNNRSVVQVVVLTRKFGGPWTSHCFVIRVVQLTIYGGRKGTWTEENREFQFLYSRERFKKFYMEYGPNLFGTDKPGLMVYPTYCPELDSKREVDILLFKVLQTKIVLAEFFSTDSHALNPKAPNSDFTYLNLTSNRRGMLTVYLYEQTLYLFTLLHDEESRIQDILLLAYRVATKEEGIELVYEPDSRYPFCSIDMNKVGILDPQKVIPYFMYFKAPPEIGTPLQQNIGEIFFITSTEIYHFNFTVASSGVPGGYSLKRSRLPQRINNVQSINDHTEYLYFLAMPYSSTSDSPIQSNYLIVYDIEKGSNRLFQENSMAGDILTMFSDKSDPYTEQFLSQTWDSVTNQNKFVMYRYRHEDLWVKPKREKLDLISGEAKLEFALKAQCMNRTTVIYEFTVMVYDSFDQVKVPETVPVVRYYNDTTATGNFRFGIPYDAGKLIGVNAEFLLDPAETMFTLERDLWDFLSYNQIAFKQKNNEKVDSLGDIGEVKKIGKMANFMLLYFKNQTMSLYKLKEDGLKLDPYLEFVCVFSYLPVPPNTLDIPEFYSMEDFNGNYLTTVVFELGSELFEHVVLKRYINSEMEDYELVLDIDAVNKAYPETWESMQGVFAASLIFLDQDLLLFNGVLRLSDQEGPKNLFFTVEIPKANWITPGVQEDRIKAGIRLKELANRRVILDAWRMGSKAFALFFLGEADANFLSRYTLSGDDAMENEPSMIVTESSGTYFFAIQMNRMFLYHESSEIVKMSSYAHKVQLEDRVLDSEYIGHLPLPHFEDMKSLKRELITTISQKDLLVLVWLSNPEEGEVSLVVYSFMSTEDHPLKRLLYYKTLSFSKSKPKTPDQVKVFHKFQVNEDGNICRIIIMTEKETVTFSFNLLPMHYHIRGNFKQIVNRDHTLRLLVRSKAHTNSPEVKMAVNLRAVEPENNEELIFPKSVQVDLYQAIQKRSPTEKNPRYFLDDLLAMGSSLLGYSVRKEGSPPKSGVMPMKLVPLVSRDTKIAIRLNELEKLDNASIDINGRIILVHNTEGFQVLDILPQRIKVIHAYSNRSEKILSVAAVNASEALLRKDDKGYRRVIVVFALIEAEFSLSSLRVFILDHTNSTNIKTSTSLFKSFVKSTFFRLAFIKQTSEDMLFSFHYGRECLNGTIWVSGGLRISPLHSFADNVIDEIMLGFEVEMLPSDIQTFGLKLKGRQLLGIFKPSAISTLSYFFFENSGQVGLLYIGEGSRTVFGYHTFSDTCILRSDTTVSCRIFEQDMDIGCIVQCDQTRVESFKLRVKVDEIEGGTKDKLSGVDVIKLEGYKIPVNYTVIHIVKGENLDFMVVNKTDALRDEEQLFILMYDTTTGLIVYRMAQSEVCRKKEDTNCSLSTTYIYQMSNNRIMIVPKNTPLSETLYMKKTKPHIEFIREELDKLESLEGYSLRIQGLTGPGKDIPLKDLFQYKEESLMWIFIGAGIFIFATLIGIFALVLYKNWGADDEEPAADKKVQKKAKKNREDGYSSFTTDRSSKGAVPPLKESLLSRQ